MNTHLLNRAIGASSPAVLRDAQLSRLLLALQPSYAHFNGQHVSVDGGDDDADGREKAEQVEVAHSGGTNSIAIDKFEGRYLLSGGADATISLWDLEAADNAPRRPGGTSADHRPLGSIAKADDKHKYGITHVSFYPFDSLAFLTSSYDHSLKIWSSETLQLSGAFPLDAVVYSHALSPIASHLLVACAVQHPTVRLVDLKSGSSAHSLAGHVGAVLSVAWSPVDEHVLCTAGTDGTVRFWDVRRGASALGVLDMEDPTGVLLGAGARARRHGRAHDGAANGVVWTDDGRHLVSTGHDEKVRVWDVARGANTLANFGPWVRNAHLSTLLPLLVRRTEQTLLLYPSDGEVLMYECFDGRLLKRLKSPPVRRRMGGLSAAAGVAGRKLKSRTTALAFRAHGAEVYSAHGDGAIRAWKPRTTEDALFEEDEDDLAREAEASRKRKRQVLEDVYADLTRGRPFGGLG